MNLLFKRILVWIPAVIPVALVGTSIFAHQLSIWIVSILSVISGICVLVYRHLILPFIQNPEEFLDKIDRSSNVLKKRLQPLYKRILKYMTAERRKIEEFVANKYIDYMKESLKYTIHMNDTYIEFDLSNIEIYSHLRIIDPEIWKRDGIRWRVKGDAKVSNPETLMRLEQRNLEYVARNIRRENLSRCVITGNAGSGKTLYLKYLALEALQRDANANTSTSNRTLPIYIKPCKWVGKVDIHKRMKDRELLKELATLELLEILQKSLEVNKVNKRIVRRYINNKVQEKKVVFLIDGLDEILLGSNWKEQEAWSQLYNQVVKDINSLISSNMAITVVMDGIKENGALGTIAKRRIEDLLPHDIPSVVKAINIEGGNDQRKQYTQHLLEHNVRFQMMAANPLGLLYIRFLQMYFSGNELQHHRAKVYQHFIENILQRTPTHHTNDIAHEDVHHFTGKKKDKRLKKLQTIAWKMHNQRKYVFSEEEMRQILRPMREILRPIRDVETYIKKHGCGLLIKEHDNGVRREDGQVRYHFLNLPIQEYLAASYLLDHQGEIGNIEGGYNNPWWEESILLYVYLSNYASKKQKKGWIYSTPHLVKHDSVVDVVRQVTKPLLEDIPQPFVSSVEAYKRLTSIIFAGRVLEMLDVAENARQELTHKINHALFYYLQNVKSLAIRESISYTIAGINNAVGLLDALKSAKRYASSNGHLMNEPNLGRWISSVDAERDLCSLLLPYLVSDLAHPMPERFAKLKFMDDRETDLIKLLLDVTPKQANLLLAALIVLDGDESEIHEFAAILMKVLNRDSLVASTAEIEEDEKKKRSELKRASIAQALGFLGGVQQIQELLEYLQSGDPQKFTAMVKWNLVDALGLIGERLGFGIDDTNVQDIERASVVNGSSTRVKRIDNTNVRNIEQALLEYSESSIDIDKDVLLKIRLTLATKFYHIQHRMDIPSDITNKLFNSRPFPAAGVHNILLNMIRDFSSQKPAHITAELESINSLTSRPDLQQFINLCDVVGQLARSDANPFDQWFEELKKACPPSNICTHPTPCTNQTLCLNSTTCSNTTTEELIEQARWLAVQRRVS